MRCIYKIVNLITGKVYIGQTKNFAQRKAGHVYSAKRNLDRPLYRSMRKHGQENFSFEIIEDNISDELINEREQFWVSHYDSFNPEKGYNLTSGGNQRTEVSEETREKISKRLKNKTFSDDHKRKISEASKNKIGQLNNFYGRNHSEETINRIKKSMKGELGPCFGRIGNKHPMWGKTHNSFVKEKMSKSHLGKKLSQKHVDAIKNGHLKRNDEKHKLNKKIIEMLSIGMSRKDIAITLNISINIVYGASSKHKKLNLQRIEQ